MDIVEEGGSHPPVGRSHKSFSRKKGTRAKSREAFLVLLGIVAEPIAGAAEPSALLFEAVPYSEEPDSLVLPCMDGALTRKTRGKAHYEKRLSRKFPRIPAPLPAPR